MSLKANGGPNVQSGRNDVDPSVWDDSQRGLERGRIRILRYRRDMPARPYCLDACPACGLRIRDGVVAQLGFCDRCREFTGMCGAGRRIICPDVLTRTTWHTPCTELGTAAWEIAQEQGWCRTVLCHVHDTQLRYGGAPWVLAAVPLDPAASPGTRRRSRRRQISAGDAS